MAANPIQDKLEERLRLAGVSIPAGQIDKLVIYFGLIAKWNTRINLTALPLDPPGDEAIDRLLVEPSVASSQIEASDGLLIDLGSGGGSPAIPLKICAPWLRLVMVEAKYRKAAFLRDVPRQLGLEDVQVVNSRFEELGAHPDLAGRADLVSIRAVRTDRALWQSVLTALGPNGRVLLFGSQTGEQGAEGSGFELKSTVPLPGTSALLVLQRRP